MLRENKIALIQCFSTKNKRVIYVTSSTFQSNNLASKLTKMSPSEENTYCISNVLFLTGLVFFQLCVSVKSNSINFQRGKSECRPRKVCT